MIERSAEERGRLGATTSHLSSWQQRNRKLEDKLHRPSNWWGLEISTWRIHLSGQVGSASPILLGRKTIQTVNLFCKLRVVKLFHWTVYLHFFTGGKKRHKLPAGLTVSLMGYYAYISELRKNTNIFPLVAENIINWSRINPTGLLIDFLRTE